MKNRRKWQTFLLVAILPLFLFFVFNWVISGWYVEQRLGCGYTLEYWDAGYSRIVHWGEAIIDKPIMSCGHDRYWIIAKTIDKDYYIIEKSKPFSWDGSDQILYGPLDSLSFYAFKQEKGIPLGLRIIPQNDK